MNTNMIDFDKIGANIKRLIKQSKFSTQREFAAACKKDTKTVNRWVKNGVDSIETLNNIAKLLEKDVKAILF